MSLPLAIPEKCLCEGLLSNLHRTTLIIATFGYLVALSLYLGVLLPVALNQEEYYHLPAYPEYTYSAPETPGSPPIAMATPTSLRMLTEV